MKKYQWRKSHYKIHLEFVVDDEFDDVAVKIVYIADAADFEI